MYNLTTQLTNPTMYGMFEKEHSTTHGVKPNSNTKSFGFSTFCISSK
jgi:hypothetical protein